MFCSSYLGKRNRINRIIVNGKALLAPIDDSLIFGPFVALSDMKKTIEAISFSCPTAMLGFKGAYLQYVPSSVPYILNITASTTIGNHVHKVLVSNVHEALVMGADCVAVHINYTSAYENEMIRNLSLVVSEADSLGMPVLAIAYPRCQNSDGSDNNYEDLKKQNNNEYTRLICHVVRSSAELGADIIKTQYTGDATSFRKVVDSAMGIPIVIAGGPLVAIQESYAMARGAMDAGAAGLSFGRNIFNAPNIPAYLAGLHAIVFDNATVNDAIDIYEDKCHVKLG